MVILLLYYGSNCYFWFVGHGGSDGLHGFVPSLDHVVADTVSWNFFLFFLEVVFFIFKQTF